MAALENVRQAKAKHVAQLMAKPNVVGVGVGEKVVAGERTGEMSVVVLVREKVPSAGLSKSALLPPELDGVKTDVIQVGLLRALQSPTDRWRPAPGGVSIGHYTITAGTFGSIVRDRTTGERLILSNNHVLANGNAAKPGDAILQPGPADGGHPETDTIARLERFVPIQFPTSEPECSFAMGAARLANAIAELIGSSHRLEAVRINATGANQVDAAVARPVNDSDVLDEIHGIGVVTGTIPAALGMLVRKSGRTTGLTTGEIIVLDATVEISYGPGQMASFENQILTSPMSQGGDSGSLVVAADSTLAVGLLFAGSEQSTVFNPIQAVLDQLNIELGPLTVTHAAEPRPAGASKSMAQHAQNVRQKYEAELMSHPNVVGVGIGYVEKGGQRTGDVGLVVLVDKKLPSSKLSPQEIIPSQIEGVPVDVQEVGKLRAQ